ncbi:hypothetical protein FACS1894132_10920 [Clostridia bacterium]|nr:hypothetical protein FACS1894132_10920 [Clostridia bacterium]
MENKTFTFRLKYLAVTIFYLRLDENFSTKKRIFFVPLKKKKAKHSKQDEANEKLSWDERIIRKSQEIQKKAYAKIDELNGENTARKADDKENLGKKKYKRIRKEKLKIGLALIKGIWKRSKKILKRTSIKDLSLNFIITDADAADCAIKYGYVNAGVYNIINIVSQKINVSLKKIFIDCSYRRVEETTVRESIYNGSFKIKITLGTIIFCLIGLVFDVGRKS